MNVSLLGLALAALFAAGLPAQGSKPAFHIPRGPISVGELIDLCELSTHASIARHADPDLLQRRLTLQTAMALGADAWQDVLGALLWSQDLVLVLDAKREGFEILPLPLPSATIVERAREIGFAEVFTRLPFGPVRVAVPSPVDVVMARTFLAPSLVMHKCFVDVAAKDGGLVLTGLGDIVRQSVGTLTGIDPELAGRLPGATALASPGVAGPIELAKGSYTVRQLADQLAKELHRNVLVRDGDAPVEIEATRSLDAARFEAAVTAALWTRQVVVVPLSLEHSLYEAVAVPGPRAHLVPRLATSMTVADVLARPEHVAFARVTWPLSHATAEQVMLALRPKLQGLGARPRELSRFFSSGTGSVSMIGLTIDLAPALSMLRELDVPPTAEKK